MIRVAIIGAGAIADSHIEAYRRFAARCRLVAVVDLYPEKAREKVARHALTAAVLGSVEALLGEVGFDAASICLPPFEHAAATVACLRAGKHVLVEKPMATCLAECDAMLEAAGAAGRVLSVVAQNRFRTPVMRLKRLLESGRLGRILVGQADSFWWRGANYYDLWWRGTWEQEGGGCTMNHAVHHVDLFQWMLGMPQGVQAFLANVNHENSEVEDFGAAVLDYAGGAVGQLTASLLHHGEEQRLVLQTERAQVGVPWQVKAVRQRENGFPEADPAVEAEIGAAYASWAPLVHEGHEGQIANFLGAIAGEEAVVVDGEQGRRAVELIAAIYAAGHAGCRVELPLGRDNPYYTRDGVLRQARRFRRKTRSVVNFARNEITFGRMS
jgi:predicted dehydrogenase